MVRWLEALVIVAALLTLGLSGCGGGVGAPEEACSGGWVTIDYPTSGSTYITSSSSIYLSGEAFISPEWFRCCSGSAEDTGVTVTVNGSPAGQSVNICYIFGTPYLYDHRWSETVELAAGENPVTVTATDPSGRCGEDTIVVTRAP